MNVYDYTSLVFSVLKCISQVDWSKKFQEKDGEFKIDDNLRY